MAALAAIVGKLEERGREPLTPREQEVMALLLRGRSIGAIAAALEVALKTVRTHIEHVHQKLHVPASAQACVILALQTLRSGCPPGGCDGLRPCLLPSPAEAAAAPAAPAGARLALTSLLARLEKEGLKPLSPREAACMASVLRGGGDKQIADSLGVAPATVCTLLTRARLKLRQSSRAAAAVAFALQAALPAVARSVAVASVHV